MSGLFATLAAAAQGGEGTLQARPRGTFEPDPVAGFEEGEDERLVAERVTEGGEVSTPPQSQPSTDRGQTAAATLFPEEKASRGGMPAGQPVKGDRPDAARTLLPPEPSAPRQPRRAEGEAENVSLGPRPQRWFEANTGQTPTHSADLSTPTPAAPAIETRNADAVAAPLLPLPGASVGREAAAASLQPQPRDPAAPRAPERRSLSIGRIEVRPPPPAPAPPAPPQQTYRATAIPRALPRQSLDDYRRRGR